MRAPIFSTRGISIFSSPSTKGMIFLYQEIDINTRDEWECAELIFEKIQSQASNLYG